MTDEEIDALCKAALADGWPFCPWIGRPEYDDHWKRKQHTRGAEFREMARRLCDTAREIKKAFDP